MSNCGIITPIKVHFVMTKWSSLHENSIFSFNSMYIDVDDALIFDPIYFKIQQEIFIFKEFKNISTKKTNFYR